MSDSSIAADASAGNQATPEQTSWLRSFLGSSDPQKPTILDDASAAWDKAKTSATELYHGAGAAVDKAEVKVKELCSDAGDAIKAIPQKFSDAGDAITDWRKHNIGTFESERGHYKSVQDELKEKDDALKEMQRREQNRADAEREHWKKVDQETMDSIRAKNQAEAEQKQRDEDGRKAMEAEYDDIRRRLQPVTPGIDPTPHPHRKH